MLGAIKWQYLFVTGEVCLICQDSCSISYVGDHILELIVFAQLSVREGTLEAGKSVRYMLLSHEVALVVRAFRNEVAQPIKRMMTNFKVSLIRNPELWGSEQITSARNSKRKSDHGLYFPFLSRPKVHLLSW